MCELVNRIEMIAGHVHFYTKDDYKMYIAQMEAVVSNLLKKRLLTSRHCEVFFRALRQMPASKLLFGNKPPVPQRWRIRGRAQFARDVPTVVTTRDGDGGAEAVIDGPGGVLQTIFNTPAWRLGMVDDNDAITQSASVVSRFYRILISIRTSAVGSAEY
eukprot:COSAG02_NODE_3558_length_6563_cov_38.861850_3_plen_159_part_00